MTTACLSKTKHGRRCKRRCKGTYCYYHASQIKKRTPKRKRSASPKKRYIPPHKRKQRKSISEKRRSASPKKRSKYVPPHLRKKLKTPPKPPTPQCVNYQYDCKHTRYGNVYSNRCNVGRSKEYNRGLMNQAKRCVDLRIQNRECRKKLRLPVTARHSHVIDRILRNIEECERLIR